jgi:hypothetical protein
MKARVCEETFSNKKRDALLFIPGMSIKVACCSKKRDNNNKDRACGTQKPF